MVLQTAIYAIAYVSMILTTVKVTASDPSDPTVFLERKIMQNEVKDATN